MSDALSASQGGEGAQREQPPGEGLLPGELVLLVDNKNRRWLLRLLAGELFHSHAGIVKHDDAIGRPEGYELRSSLNTRYRVFRPTLSDFVLNMKRGAQVIYPKDLGPILMLADIAPGRRVLESGVGSGALSMALLRAGADVIGCEIRTDFAARARKNVESFLGAEALERYKVYEHDSYEGLPASGLDRVLLDLPEPWRVAEHACAALRPGGILLAYAPSIIQVCNLRKSLSNPPWALAETCEVLLRGWHVVGEAVRPDHRMVAHTGFLTYARRLAD